MSNGGHVGDTGFIMESINPVGAWRLTPEGEFVENEEFVLEASQDVADDGTQVLHYELNPEAVWNDGTPIDFYTYEHTLNILSGEDEAFDVRTTDMYDQVESMEMGDDEWSFTITMEEMYQPWQTLFDFGHLIHPEVDTPEMFNDGFIDDVQNDFRAGPFRVDILGRAAQVLSLVPNENWWGDEPMLDRLNWVRFESGSDIQAFQNGELDSVTTLSAERVEEMLSWQPEGEEYEIRRGQRMFAGGYRFNADSPQVADVAIREAIFRAVDRQTLSDVRFQELGWEEEPTGSWIAIPCQDYHRDDAYPVEDNDPEGAAQVMEDAGYVRDSEEDYFVDPDTGEEVVVTLSTFGTDSTGQAVDQSFQTMIRDAGINLELENRGSGEFASTMAEGDHSLVGVGTGAQPDPTLIATTLYAQVPSNDTNIGDDELDEWIEELSQMEDFEERSNRAAEIEREAIARYFHYLGYQNGPNIFTVRTGLANYGPKSFDQRDWTVIGWEADSDHDGTDTGVDSDELEDTDPDEEFADDDEENGGE